MNFLSSLVDLLPLLAGAGRAPDAPRDPASADGAFGEIFARVKEGEGAAPPFASSLFAPPAASEPSQDLAALLVAPRPAQGLDALPKADAAAPPEQATAPASVGSGTPSPGATIDAPAVRPADAAGGLGQAPVPAAIAGLDPPTIPDAEAVVAVATEPSPKNGPVPSLPPPSAEGSANVLPRPAVTAVAPSAEGATPSAPPAPLSPVPAVEVVAGGELAQPRPATVAPAVAPASRAPAVAAATTDLVSETVRPSGLPASVEPRPVAGPSTVPLPVAAPDEPAPAVPAPPRTTEAVTRPEAIGTEPARARELRPPPFASHAVETGERARLALHAVETEERAPVAPGDGARHPAAPRPPAPAPAARPLTPETIRAESVERPVETKTALPTPWTQPEEPSREPAARPVTPPVTPENSLPREERVAPAPPSAGNATIDARAELPKTAASVSDEPTVPAEWLRSEARAAYDLVTNERRAASPPSRPMAPVDLPIRTVEPNDVATAPPARPDALPARPAAPPEPVLRVAAPPAAVFEYAEPSPVRAGPAAPDTVTSAPALDAGGDAAPEFGNAGRDGAYGAPPDEPRPRVETREELVAREPGASPRPPAGLRDVAEVSAGARHTTAASAPGSASHAAGARPAGAAPALGAHGAAIVQQVTARLSALTPGRAVTIALEPAELGKVFVRFTRDDGEWTVRLAAERADVGTLLARGAARLETALLRGDEPMRVEVSVQQDSSASDEHATQREGGENAERLHRSRRAASRSSAPHLSESEEAAATVQSHALLDVVT